MSIDPKPAPLPKEFTDAVKSIGKYYMYDYKGIRIDPYRILSVYGIVCPAMQHAIKKLLRCGKSIKTEREDILEVMSTLERKLEMLNEDSNMQSGYSVYEAGYDDAICFSATEDDVTEVEV